MKIILVIYKMKTATSHNIRNRKKANDIFITPLNLAKKHIQMVKEYYNKQGKIWYDPFRNSGNYFKPVGSSK